MATVGNPPRVRRPQRLTVTWATAVVPALAAAAVYGLGSAVLAHVGVWGGDVVDGCIIAVVGVGGMALLRLTGGQNGRGNR